MSVWPEAVLGDVLADATPGFACGDDVEDGVFQFRMNNITTEGQLDLKKRRRVPRDYRNIERFFVQPGDVLFNATNSPELVGKTAYFPGLEEPAVFSNHFLRLRPGAGQIDGRYLTRWLNLQFQHGQFKAMCRQWVNQATVGRDALLSLRVPFPPLPEQRRIAEILDKADALRTKRRAALAQLGTITQSIFLDMFGDPATNPKEWPVLTVGDVADVQGGLQVTRARHGLPLEVPYLRVGNVYRGSLDLREIKRMRVTEVELARTTLRTGDLLIVEGHGNPEEIGRGALWDGSIERCVHQNHLIRLRFVRERVEPLYACEYLNSPGGRRHLLRAGKTTSGLNTISVSEVRGTPIAVPDGGAQRRFTERVMKLRKTSETHHASLREIDALFATLQDRAFRGRMM